MDRRCSVLKLSWTQVDSLEDRKLSGKILKILWDQQKSQNFPEGEVFSLGLLRSMD